MQSRPADHALPEFRRRYLRSRASYGAFRCRQRRVRTPGSVEEAPEVLARRRESSRMTHNNRYPMRFSRRQSNCEVGRVRRMRVRKRVAFGFGGSLFKGPRLRVQIEDCCSHGSAGSHSKSATNGARAVAQRKTAPDFYGTFGLTADERYACDARGSVFFASCHRVRAGAFAAWAVGAACSLWPASFRGSSQAPLLCLLRFPPRHRASPNPGSGDRACLGLGRLRHWRDGGSLVTYRHAALRVSPALRLSDYRIGWIRGASPLKRTQGKGRARREYTGLRLSAFSVSAGWRGGRLR